MQDLNITLMQTPLHWHDAAANRAQFEQYLADLKQPTDLIILPEMFTTGFTNEMAALAETMDGATVTWLRQMAETYQAVITGSFIITVEGRYYNRLVWVPPQGELSYYDKRHLFRMAQEHRHYTEGRHRLITTYRGWRICPLICYDLRFPVWSRNLYFDDVMSYDVLLYTANWPARRRHAWQTLLKARAIENQCYVVGVNRVGTDGQGIAYSGDSVVVNYIGEELMTPTQETLITTVCLSYQELQDYRAKFPAYLDADSFMIE